MRTSEKSAIRKPGREFSPGPDQPAPGFWTCHPTVNLLFKLASLWCFFMAAQADEEIGKPDLKKNCIDTGQLSGKGEGTEYFSCKQIL